MRKTLLVSSTALIVAGVAGFAAPASAAGTTTTFIVGAGALSVSAPASGALGTGSPGATASAALGSVTVNDARASLLGTWTTSVIGSAFTTGGGTSAETIPASAVTYASGPATATTGLGVFVPGQLTTLLAVPIDSSQVAFVRAASVGNSTATWSPTVIVNVPAAAVAGTYTGTITHSVA